MDTAHSQAIYDSPFDYLNPANHVTPLVELDGLDEVKKTRIRLFAKMAPLGNIKTIPAYYMLEKAKRSGRLAGVNTLVEASSGNMAAALCDLCPKFGLKRFIAVIPNDTAPGKQNMLHLKGAEIQFANTLPDVMTPIQYAKELGKQKGFFNLCQYENPDNPEAYKMYLGHQIFMQLKEIGLGRNPLVFCAGMGTCGTLIGCGEYFKEVNSACHIVGVNLRPGEMVPGVRDLQRLQEITLNWKYIIDQRIQIGRDPSYRRSLQLCRMGLDAGPSSGFALEGLLQFLKENGFEKEAVAVFICPDSYKLYSEKFGTILRDEDFKRKKPFGM